MTKILILQQEASHYDIPVFNKLAEKVDLKLIYSRGKEPKNAKFSYECIPTIKKGLRVLHERNIIDIAQEYDVVICILSFTEYYFKKLPYIKHRNYKVIYWGIGVSAGYTQRYDANQRFVLRVFKYMKKADAMLYYCDYPVEKYAKLGLPREKMFVANNTVEIPYIEDLPVEQKDSFLFVGTLYKEKRIDALLNAYLDAYQLNPDLLPLTIIGDGDERKTIEQFILDNQLTGKIFLTGAIYDEQKLIPYFQHALLCISPDQAGLSVLKSMGYGVPFVTHKNAITGGEIFNIQNNVNGIQMDDFDELKDILLDATANKETYVTMGKKAKEFYWSERTIDAKVNGFMDAIEYVLK